MIFTCLRGDQHAVPTISSGPGMGKDEWRIFRRVDEEQWANYGGIGESWTVVTVRVEIVLFD